MPTYNTGKYLKGSIESILHQTYTSLELIIVDDCSKDNVTKEIIKEMAKKDRRIKYIFLNSNHGASYARNIAIEAANGRYIAFCDSDDKWTTEKLEKQINLMTQKKCALSCTSYYICDSEYNITGVNNPPKHITYEMMKKDDKIGCSTAIYDILLLGKKYYMPQIHQCEDWGLFLSIIKDCHNCYAYTEKPLAFYCIRTDSLSRNKIAQIKYNLIVHKEVLGYSTAKAYFAFVFHFIPTYISKVIKRKVDSYFYKMSKK